MFFYRSPHARRSCSLTSKEIIEETEGTMLRARVELALAWKDLKTEIRKEIGLPAAKILSALARFIGWFTRGKS
jgi:hypothetical protein